VRPHIIPLDQRITLKDYDGELRQLVITDLGHEEPTLLLTTNCGGPRPTSSDATPNAW
jgi:hypothetical protein